MGSEVLSLGPGLHRYSRRRALIGVYNKIKNGTDNSNYRHINQMPYGPPLG